MKKDIYLTNALKKMAEEYIDSPNIIENSEIAKINITDIWEREIYEQMLLARESINININAKVRMGKSTVMMAIAKRIQNSMVRLKFTKNKWSIYNIARTLYELSKKMRNPELNNIVIGIDEFDDLEQSQMNATVEQSLLSHFSKIQAGRYIHRVYCSPGNQPDSGSDIQVIIDQPNKKLRKTKCYVYYKVQREESYRIQLIGYIIVDVSDIIKNWIDQGIEEKFYKFNKTQKDLDFIEYWRRKDWYVDYMVRKFQKMDLINKKGIFQSRELDYADIYLECVEKLKPLTKIKGLITQKQVKNELKMLFRKYVVPTTILGDNLMADKVDGILDYYKEFWDLGKRMKAMKDKFQKNKMHFESYKAEMDLMKDSKDRIAQAITEQMEELRELAELKKSFYGEIEYGKTNKIEQSK